MIGDFLGLPKPSSLKQAGWFKKLFRKIKRFFQRIFQAVVKVLIKIRNALQKFLQTGFGKVVGFIFGGPLILAALNFAINSFSYLAQGDIKGLFKYWAQNALQIALLAASFALMFIPGLGQALAAGLQFLMKGLFAAVQFALGAAVQLLGTAISGIGSFIGSFASGLGGFVRGIGGFISQAGSRLMSQAQAGLKEIFSNLKSAFSRVGESLNRSLGGYRPNANPLPPHAGIEIGRPLPDGVTLPKGNSFADYSRYFQALPQQGRSANPLQAQIEKTVTDVLITIVTGGRIDKQGEGGKITNVLEAIVSTLVHSGTEALKERFLNQFSPASSLSPMEAAGVRGPPPNLPQIQAGANQSSRLLSPYTGNQPLFQRTLDSYGRGNYVFAYNGNGNPYQYQSSKSSYPQKLEKLSADRYRGENESGRFIEGRFNNARPNESPRIEVIDNLKSDGVSLPDQIYGRLIGRNANDLLSARELAQRIKIPVDMTEAEVDRLLRTTGGKLSDRNGWIFRGREVDSYRKFLPQAIQNELNKDAGLQQYFQHQPFIFIGDTTKAGEFVRIQANNPSLNPFQRFLNNWILGSGDHNVIGLPQRRVMETHLTDLYEHPTEGFVMWHNNDSPNARLGGALRHWFIESPIHYVRTGIQFLSRFFPFRRDELS